MSRDFIQSIRSIAAGLHLKKTSPKNPPATNAPTFDEFSTVENENVKPSSNLAFSGKSTLPIDPEIKKYEIRTPGLEIINADEHVVSMVYRGNKLKASLIDHRGKPVFNKITFEDSGIEIDFFLLPDIERKRLDLILDSALNAIEYAKKTEGLKELKDSLQIEGSIESGVIFSLKNDSGEARTFICKNNKISELSGLSPATIVPPEVNSKKLSYGSELWTKHSIS